MPAPDPYAALRIPEYRRFITARVFITVAIQIQAVVVGWQVYELTKDPLSLGLIGLAEALPSITVSILGAGHVADFVHRKKIIVITVFALLACSVALLTFTTDPGAFVFQWGVVPIYSVIFVSGIARGFLSPAVFSFMPQIVPRELYQNAITWNSTLWEAASITGPAIGGLVYGFYGITAAYALDAALVLAGLTLIFFIQKKPLPPPANEDVGVIDKLTAGFRFVFQNKLILSAITLDLFAVFFGGAVALLPFFADEILHVGAVGLGFLRSAPSIGAVAMAFYVTHYPIRKHMGKMLLWSVAGFGACMICFALSHNFWLSLGLLIASGMFDCVSVIIRGSLMQTLTPENMKGRVSAVNYIFIGSSNELGMFESGFAASVLGLIPSVIFGGFMTIGVVAATAWLSKSLRRLQNLDKYS
jgi:MFS family permease